MNTSRSHVVVRLKQLDPVRWGALRFSIKMGEPYPGLEKSPKPGYTGEFFFLKKTK